MYSRVFAVVGLALLAGVVACVGEDKLRQPTQLESIPPEEADQIKHTMQLTIEQLKKRYPGKEAVLRGVHPKDHGCVMAKFKVLDTLAEDLRVGVFSTPGHEYQAWIRFSNAAVLVAADSPSEAGVTKHGSRGMAIKLLGVSGTPLVKNVGPLTQDFVMINQPVFAFSNVEDYEALSDVLLKDSTKANEPGRFFKERIRKKADGTPDLADPMTQRALKTLGIVQRIQSLSVTADPPAYQAPPASPVDNRYFSAAPFLFGPDKVMKFSAKPVSPASGDVPNVADKDYLRTALHKRLTASNAEDVLFEFQVQVRSASDVAGKIKAEIEDAHFEWDEKKHPFVTVAMITIPPQDFDTPERRRLCEDYIFTPWQGIAEHRPLGGINRLRLAVYEASAAFRHEAKEPTGF
jgi:hypothetical protein